MRINGHPVNFKADLRQDAQEASFKFLRMCFLGLGYRVRSKEFGEAADDVVNAVEKLRMFGEEW